jgi:hypothetical protein
LLFRGYTCPPGCGGCCPRFSLDYLPWESPPIDVRPRIIEIDGRRVTVLSDLQIDHRNYHCRHLDQSTGRCKIYDFRPFSCDFELIRFIQQQGRTLLLQKLFGRGWAMLRVDGERGALCEMLPGDEGTTREVVGKLERLEEWANYFGIPTVLPEIIAWVASGPHAEPLQLEP